jgi:hypothetical protein
MYILLYKFFEVTYNFLIKDEKLIPYIKRLMELTEKDCRLEAELEI